MFCPVRGQGPKNKSPHFIARTGDDVCSLQPHTRSSTVTVRLRRHNHSFSVLVFRVPFTPQSSYEGGIHQNLHLATLKLQLILNDQTTVLSRDKKP